MIKTTLGKDLTTSSVLQGRNTVHTSFMEPRQNMNPGELLTAALGGCMLTMVGYMASKRGDNAEGTTADIAPRFDEKHSRIIAFDIVLTFPSSFTQTQKEAYGRAAQTCPVHNSLREDIQYTITVK